VTSPATTHTATSQAVPTPSPAAQVHALRALAEFLEHTGVPGLSLTLSADRINIQVPEHTADAHTRAATVALLATAVGGTARRETAPGPTCGWVFADGLLSGHVVHLYTAIGAAS
jgi:hypothetical protein